MTSILTFFFFDTAIWVTSSEIYKRNSKLKFTILTSIFSKSGITNRAIAHHRADKEKIKNKSLKEYFWSTLDHYLRNFLPESKSFHVTLCTVLVCVFHEQIVLGEQ